MPTLAPGNPERWASRRTGPTPVPASRAWVSRPTISIQQMGFTLLELMVVVAIVAMPTAGVSLSLRETTATQLEQEGRRLVALLESGRAQSRTLGVAVFWRPGPRGFVLDGQFRPWVAEGTQVLAPAQAANESVEVALGPEPLIAPQQLALRLQGRTLWLSTDGLRPFVVSAEIPGSAPVRTTTP